MFLGQSGNLSFGGQKDRSGYLKCMHLDSFQVSDTHPFLVKFDGLKRMNGESKLHEEKQSYASDWSREMFGIFRVGMNTWTPVFLTR